MNSTICLGQTKSKLDIVQAENFFCVCVCVGGGLSDNFLSWSYPGQTYMDTNTRANQYQLATAADKLTNTFKAVRAETNVGTILSRTRN